MKSECLSTPLGRLSPGKSLKIGLLADLHIPANPAALATILGDRAHFEAMDYLVLLGDQCAGYGSDEEYRGLNEFLRKLQKPYTAVSGNHEFHFEIHPEGTGIWREQDAGGKALQLEKFRDFFGLGGLWGAERTESGRFLFLSLNPTTPGRPERLCAAQSEFLARQLDEAREETAWIFCHAPLPFDASQAGGGFEPVATGCLELEESLFCKLRSRAVPAFWISGHVHLRPDHPLYEPYRIAPHLWQIHCPDARGVSRWLPEHAGLQVHPGVFSRYLEIGASSLRVATRDHRSGKNRHEFHIDFPPSGSA